MPTRTFRRAAMASVVPLLALTFSIGCVPKKHGATDPASLMPPEPAREFRAAWVATVGNIDWPSRSTLSTEEQQREIIEILDEAQRLKMNAIVLQVRTSCDAFYPSELEPWSRYLTGAQGKAPEPFYDPLKMWIDEAHKRGLELHAWFNPYRARAGGAKGESAPNHISKTNPAIVKSFNGYEWLDPAEPAAQDLTYNVFLDVVKRYDVDGIHIDDYFYPYPDYLVNKETKKPDDFPDEPSWNRYVESGGKLSRADWRRHNVDVLVERIYKGIKKEKPHVQFGISPFGIAEPGKPPTVKSGFNQKETLYADAKLWLNEGWCDYYTPQLYWPVNSDQPYEDLVAWWANENTKGRHLWPGLFTSRVSDGSARAFSVQNITDQIHVTRATPGATGHVHFSMKAIMRDFGVEYPEGQAPPRRGRRGGDAADGAQTQPATTQPTTQPTKLGIAGALADGPYAEAALVPASPWLDDRAPAAPKFDVASGCCADAGLHVTWKPAGREPARVWAVYAKYNAAWKLHVFPADAREASIASDPVLGEATAATVFAVDRMGNASKIARAKTPAAKK